jgi:hypothetical protein
MTKKRGSLETQKTPEIMIEKDHSPSPKRDRLVLSPLRKIPKKSLALESNTFQLIEMNKK